MASLDMLTQSPRTFGTLLAERTGRKADDLAIRTLSGALVGVIWATVLHWAEHPEEDPFRALDESLAQLQNALR
jgi:hypothetical protein